MELHAPTHEWRDVVCNKQKKVEKYTPSLFIGFFYMKAPSCFPLLPLVNDHSSEKIMNNISLQNKLSTVFSKYRFAMAAAPDSDSHINIAVIVRISYVAARPSRSLGQIMLLYFRENYNSVYIV